MPDLKSELETPKDAKATANRLLGPSHLFVAPLFRKRRRPPSPPLLEIEEARRSPSGAPSLEDILLEEEHEVSVRRRSARRKRAQDSAAKTRRHSLRLAAKEDPFYVDATSKATRVKAAQLDLTRASAHMKEALACSGILQRPAPPKITSSKLRCLARVCGIPDLPDEEVREVA